MSRTEYRGGRNPYRLSATSAPRGWWPRRTGKGIGESLAALFPAVDFGAGAALTALYGGGSVRLGDGCIIQGQLVLASPRGAIDIGEDSFLAAGGAGERPGTDRPRCTCSGCGRGVPCGP